MTNRQSAELNMVEIVGNHIADNKKVTDEFKMIARGATKLAARKSNIDALAKLQVTSTKGVTAVKNTTLAQIKEAGETHRSNLCSFAKETEKVDILADFDMTATEFKKGGEQKVLARNKDLLSTSRTIETHTLAPDFKLEKADNDGFENLLNSYQPKKVNQSTKKNSQKKITLDLKQEFVEARAILDQLDDDVKNNASKKYPDFVEGYFIARKVIVHGGPPPPKDPPSGGPTTPPKGV